MQTLARCSYRCIKPRLLVLVAICDNALNMYLNSRSTLTFSSGSAKARAVCYCAVECRSPVKYVTQNAQDVDCCLLFRQLYPLQRQFFFGDTKRQVRILKLN